MSAFSEIVLDYVPPDPLLLAGPLQHLFFGPLLTIIRSTTTPPNPFIPKP